MNILIVCQYFTPEPFLVGDLAGALAERGHRVTVLTGYPNYPQGRLYPGYRQRPIQREDHEGVEVVRVPLFPDTSYVKWRRMANYLSYALSASTLGAWALRGRRFDRIITFQLSPVTIGLPAVALKFWQRSEAPIYHWVQDIWPESLQAAGLASEGTVIGLIRRLVRFLYHRAHTVVVQSPGFVPLVEAHGVPADRIAYLPNWAEDLYQPAIPDPTLAEEEDLAGGFKIVFAGNLGAAQGLETVIEAAALLRDEPAIRFIILGDGAMGPELQRQASERGLSNVVFKGRRPTSAMPAFFAHADVLLVQLKRDPLFALTIPSKIQSYLACGRPVLAALEGSGAEVIRAAGAGVVVEPESAEALRDGVLALYRMAASERAAMGARARAFYTTNFSRTHVVDTLVEMMERDHT